jgi:hypothetical protein
MKLTTGGGRRAAGGGRLGSGGAVAAGRQAPTPDALAMPEGEPAIVLHTHMPWVERQRHVQGYLCLA